jgi:hypothetical protein
VSIARFGIFFLADPYHGVLAKKLMSVDSAPLVYISQPYQKITGNDSHFLQIHFFERSSY